MTHEAASALGLSLRVLAERPDDSAALVASAVDLGGPGDLAALERFAASCDVVTFDHELIPSAHLAALQAAGYALRPGPAALLFAQDKLYQRTELARRGFPVPAFAEVGSADEIAAFASEHGWPTVLKTSRGGYDGRGVWVVRDEAESAAAFADASRSDAPLLVEEMVDLDREVAILVARRPSGELAVYPVVETVQADGMCREVIAPAPIPPQLAAQAAEIARGLASLTDAVGVVAIELFLDRAGGLLVNELALRPHNSGHYSIEGCVTSQFENHLRAVLDWPLGSTALTAPSVVTVNVVGSANGADPLERLPAALAVPGVHVHLYGKGARPGRKLGHVTALGDDPVEVRARAQWAAALLTGETEERM